MQRSHQIALFKSLILVGVASLVIALAPTRTVTDRMGRSVVVPIGGPQRVVTMNPSIAEMLVWLGMNDRIVAVSEFTDLPEVQDRPRVGGPMTPNAEYIVTLRPDLVVLDRNHNPKSLADLLDRVGVPYFVVATQGIEDVRENLRLLGEVFGCPERAQAWWDRWTVTTQCLDKTAWKRRPRAFFLLWERPVYTVGWGSFILEVLEHAGLDVVTRAVPRPWPQVDLEAVVRWDPEVLLIPANQYASVRANLEALPAWRSVTAVRAGRVISVPTRILHPSPYLLDVLREIVERLHGEGPWIECFR
ncbi:MAG: ABC transporter substrate-binding protein [Acidobacteria bacterium]|nr:ABC transporter substrate-binding protein [Acidobacteriota bacterium]MDW7985036.1 ABC transporter substrate-binding protein [Acidobacteriota bacterium]